MTEKNKSKTIKKILINKLLIIMTIINISAVY